MGAYLFLDMDNTLISSHRHPCQQPFVWVEELKGRNQSYVTQKTYRYFEKQEDVTVIPITTRSRQQFDRLMDMTDHFGWDLSLICNGSILLIKGEEDPVWTKESKEISAPDRNAYESLLAVVRSRVSSENLVCVNPFLFYVKSDEPGEMMKFMQENANLDHLSIYRDARKVYCIPVSLHKGSAVERFRKRFGNKLTYAAGDSAFDLPMLEMADIALYPETLKCYLEDRKNAIFCPAIFSDSICDILLKLKREET